MRNISESVMDVQRNCKEKALTNFFYNSQPRATCSSVAKTMDISLGEKKNLIFGMGENYLKKEKEGTGGWTEEFQDLRTWCPALQDELHTPIFNLNNDEFNFDIDERKILDKQSPVDEGHPWGNEFLLDQNLLFNEEKNLPPVNMPYYNNNNMYPDNSYVPIMKSPLRSSNSDILLSQTIEEKGSVRQKIMKMKPRLGLVIPSKGNVCSLDTPDVIKSLGNDGFDLIRYVESDEVSSAKDHDHDYDDPLLRPVKPEDLIIKAEPLSPESVEKELPAPKSPVNRRKRRLTSESDFIYDSDDMSDSSDSWESKKKNTSRGKRSEKKEALPVTGVNKYRELRDRNNEASRRSRYNRKQRDNELQQVAQKLQKEHVELKTKAERMERLVEDLRAIILQTVSKKNSQNVSDLIYDKFAYKFSRVG